MNKLFPLHSEFLGSDHHRPYYSNDWEPIAIDVYLNAGFPSFQYKRTSTEYFYVGQVISSTETDITAKFRAGTELIDDWTSADVTIIHDGRNISDYQPNYDNTSAQSNTFALATGDYLNFRIDCSLVTASTSSITIELKRGSTIHHSYVMHNGKNEIAYKITAGASDYFINFKNQNEGTLSFHDSTISCQKCKYDIHNDYVTYYGGALYSAPTTGVCTFIMQSTTHFYSDWCLVAVDNDWFSDQLKISISSAVDFADIYYKGGFTQTLYRLANVRRSPEPKIEVIGSERNGKIVQEKVITATRYQCKIKCSEEIMDALTTAIGATVTITDQTGKVFTCYNMEIEKPTWYRTNGILTLSFDDNINVFTENQTDL
jgi:hypothetical protein